LSKVRIDPKFHTKYGPIVLWWDDIEEIFEILQTNASSVELETAQYKFTTLSVAKEHFGDTPQKDFKISASSPFCSFDKDSLCIGSGQSAAHIFYNIDKVLKKRERRPKWLHSWWLGVPAIGLGLPSLFLKIPEPYVTVLTGIQVVLSVLYARAIYVTMKSPMIVHTKRRSEARGFFQRNKDQLLMYMITGVVGAVVGFGLSQAKDKYLPEWLKLEQKP
jgi:hypothetical protein